MNNLVLEVAEALEMAKLYEEKDMCFSAALLWEKIVTLQPTENRQFRYADCLRLCGHFLKSEKVFLQIDVSKIPVKNQCHYHLHLGQLYMDMGSINKAKAALIACLDYENCDTAPYVFIASMLKEDKDNAEAIYYLKMALDKEGDIDEVCYNLSYRLAIKGDFENALEVINKCLHIDPFYPNATQLKNDISSYLSAKDLIVI